MRRDFDFYETAPWQVDALVDHVPEIQGSILFPCVGDGSLMDRLIFGDEQRAQRFGFVVTNDIDPRRKADTHYDARLPLLYEEVKDVYGDIDYIVDNPPFNIEIDILMEAYKHVRYGVIFMSRLSFTEPTFEVQKRKGRVYPNNPRGPWLKGHPMFKQVVLERYSFTGDGASDSVTTAWNVWLKPGVVISNPGIFSAYGYRPRETR